MVGDRASASASAGAGAGVGGHLVAVGCNGRRGARDGDGDDRGVWGCGDGGAQCQDEGEPLGFGEHCGGWSGGRSGGWDVELVVG